MGNPGNTVQVIVQAQTEQALQAVKQFAAQSSGALNVLSAGTKQVAADAAKASEHVAGMAYYFRSGIDSIRFAMMGGGERAGFYAVDEAVRGLISSGMKLSTLVPVLGGLGAAVAAVVLVFHEWNSAQAEAEKHAKDLVDAWKEMPGILQQIADMQQAGLLSPQSAGEYADYLTGHKKLYVDNDGNVTTQPTRQIKVGAAGDLSGVLGAPPMMTQTQTANNQQLEKSDPRVRQWVQDQMTAGGELAKEQLEALNKAHEELRKFNEESLQGIEKQKQEVVDRYDEERRQMELTLKELQATMDTTTLAHSKQAQDLQAALAQIPKNQQAELAAIDRKYSEQQVTVRQMGEDFSAANSVIEDQITAKAQQEGKKRESLWQEEYALRIGLAVQMLASLQITEGQYSDAIRKAKEDALQSHKKVNEESMREQQMRGEIRRGQIEAQLGGIENNPFDQEKTEESIPLYQQLLSLNASRISDLSKTATTTSDVSAQLQAQKQIVELTQQQVALQQKLNAAQGESSWTYQLVTVAAHFADIKTLAQTTADIFASALNTGINSVASNFTKVLEGTEKWHKALLNIEQAIVGNIIEAIIKAAEQWMVSEVMKFALAQTLQAAALAGSATMAVSESLIWWTPAILSAIASGGTTAADAAGLVGAALVGYAEGGRPDVGRIALVGERGPELFIPDSAGTVIPAHQTAAILQGRGDAGGNSSVNVEGHRITQHFYDSRPHPRDYFASSEGEQQFIDLARKHRTKIGIGT